MAQIEKVLAASGSPARVAPAYHVGLQIIGNGFGATPGTYGRVDLHSLDGATQKRQHVLEWSDTRIAIAVDPGSIIPFYQRDTVPVSLQVTNWERTELPPYKFALRLRVKKGDRPMPPAPGEGQKMLAGFNDATIILGVPHSLTATAGVMFRDAGLHNFNKADFPLDPWQFENSFCLPWALLVLCEPLSVVGAYEQRRGHVYDDPLQVFAAAWLGLWGWVCEARRRGVYPDRMNIICMDRTHYPARNIGAAYEADVGDIAELVKAKNTRRLLADPRYVPYVHWMRENREIFEFVDGVGRYESGWWLESESRL